MEPCTEMKWELGKSNDRGFTHQAPFISRFQKGETGGDSAISARRKIDLKDTQEVGENESKKKEMGMYRPRRRNRPAPREENGTLT